MDPDGSLDPDIINPCKNKIIKPADKAKKALFMAITEYADGWFLYHWDDGVSRKEDRKSLRLKPCRAIESTPTVNKAIVQGRGVLCLYVDGVYKPKKAIENTGKIDFFQIDISDYHERIKAKRLKNISQ